MFEKPKIESSDLRIFSSTRPKFLVRDEHLVLCTRRRDRNFSINIRTQTTNDITAKKSFASVKKSTLTQKTIGSLKQLGTDCQPQPTLTFDTEKKPFPDTSLQTKT